MAGQQDHFNLSVLGEKGVIYYGVCKLLFVPGEKETVAVMAHHTPMIMKLSKGHVVAQEGRTKRTLAEIESGLLYVGDDEVTVLVNL